MPLKILDTPSFGRVVKKLHTRDKKVVDEAVGAIAADPTIGEEKKGDLAGIGCFVDSCRDCEFCKSDEEHMCVKGCALTYNSTEMDKKTRTFGGYSTRVRDKHSIDAEISV